MDPKDMTLDELIKKDRAAGRGGRGGFRGGRGRGGHRETVDRFRDRGNGIFKQRRFFREERGRFGGNRGR